MAVMVNAAAKMLLAGEEGADVVDFLRAELAASAERGGRPFSCATLKTYVSQTKSQVIAADFRNAECDFSALQPFTNEPDVAAFLVAPLKKQLELKRRHRAHPDAFPSWPEEAVEALQGLELLPRNMNTFKIAEHEVRAIKRADKRNLHARMGNVVVISDGAALLARAEALLRSATPKDGYVALVAPLLLVSGRREIEILNVCTGRASFEKVGDRSVLFTGQAKTKCSERAPGYVIPLLVEAGVFLHALSVLQQKRGDAWNDVSNHAIHKSMSGFFTPVYLRQAFPMLPEEGCKWHLLRSLYLQYVSICFEHTMAVNFLGKRVLGHFDESESLRYVSTRVDGMEQALKGAFGELDLSLPPT